MMYSCALFERARATLEEAQLAKLERICERARAEARRPPARDRHRAGAGSPSTRPRRGCRVTTTTISREQHDYADERVRAAGLEDRVTVLGADYRDLDGSYDKLVSIEMIEAVGWQYFDSFFERCSALLEPDGLFFLQAITIDDRAYEAEKTRQSFANKLIFPGGCLPSLGCIQRSLARRTDMRPVWLDDISPSYALTLVTGESASSRREQLEELGYDEPFRRLWALWLAMSEAGSGGSHPRPPDRVREAGVARVAPANRIPDRALPPPERERHDRLREGMGRACSAGEWFVHGVYYPRPPRVEPLERRVRIQLSGARRSRKLMLRTARSGELLARRPTNGRASMCAMQQAAPGHWDALNASLSPPRPTSTWSRGRRSGRARPGPTPSRTRPRRPAGPLAFYPGRAMPPTSRRAGRPAARRLLGGWVTAEIQGPIKASRYRGVVETPRSHARRRRPTPKRTPSLTRTQGDRRLLLFAQNGSFPACRGQAHPEFKPVSCAGDLPGF